MVVSNGQYTPSVHSAHETAVLSVVDAAAYARTSWEVISEAISAGELPARVYRGDALPKIRSDELDAWIKSQPRYVPVKTDSRKA